MCLRAGGLGAALESFQFMHDASLMSHVQSYKHHAFSLFVRKCTQEGMGPPMIQEHTALLLSAGQVADAVAMTQIQRGLAPFTRTVSTQAHAHLHTHTCLTTFCKC